MFLLKGKRIVKYVLLFLVAVTLCVANSCANNTNFIDKKQKVSGFAETQWYLDAIPFIDIPDSTIEMIYYYRWSLLKRHIRYAQPGSGYVFTEFIAPVLHSHKFATLNDAAGHHINEAKWLRNREYVQDYINFWCREGGATQQYSEWIADASWNAYGITGDKEFLRSQQQGFVKNFDNWSDHFEPLLGLYFITPDRDAQELSCASVQTNHPVNGGLGYRPSFNSEMYANAVAISNIAALNNDSSVESEFRKKANKLRHAILDNLWDGERNFFYHMQRENNENHTLLDSREEVGFYPFRFGVPNNDSYTSAWVQLADTEGFNATYGPLTCEKRSKWYDGTQKPRKCCYWNGNSWPYSTSITLGALANTINNYKQDVVDKHDYYELLLKYARTSFKNGEPYVAECHSPVNDVWVCDTKQYSEHYFHSTFVDNVLGELFGITPRADNVFELNPLIPDDWDYFAVENLLFHGHNVTILYDRRGTYYNKGKGLMIYLNGNEIMTSPELKKLSINIPEPELISPQRRANYAVNVNGNNYPNALASFTNNTGNRWQAIDGKRFYDTIPTNRWSNYLSPNDRDWFEVDFGRAKEVNEVRLYFYSDIDSGGQTDCPKSYIVQIFDGQNWTDAENQTYNPENCSPNDLNIISFTPIKTQQLRVVFERNKEKNYYLAITELEVWSSYPQTASNTYEAEDGYLVNSEIRASDSASGGSYVTGIHDQDSIAEINGVWVSNEGNYHLEIYYCNAVDGGLNATQTLFINNLHEIVVHFPFNCDSWGVFRNGLNGFVRINVPLLRGSNSLVFRYRSYFVELDKLVLDL